MLFEVLSLLDIIAGVVIYSSAISGALAQFVWILIIIMLFKGAYSIAAAFSSNYYFEWPGFLDVISGAALFLISYDILPASRIIGVIVIGKGGYYLVRSALKI